MLKIFSWNVNGLRAVLRKGALQGFIAKYQPDILCLQETKAKPGQAEVDLPEYEEIWNSAERSGYAGTAVFTKIKPLSTEKYEMGIADNYGDLSKEGRVIVAEFETFYLVNVYTPNSKPDLSRLELRFRDWDPGFLTLLRSLEKKKPVVACGDFNAAFSEIDLARPESNHHSAGFTDEERQGIGALLDAGFVDTFRALHPEERRYTWWSHWGQARARNVGWRIDYFFVSEGMFGAMKGAEIYEGVTGSDHCPISVTLDVGDGGAGSHASADDYSDNRGAA